MSNIHKIFLMSLTDPLVPDPQPEQPPVSVVSNPKKPKKKRIILKIGLTAIGIIALSVVLALTVFKDNVDHLIADYYFSQKQYEIAQTRYEALGDFQDSAVKKDEATFYIAKAQLEEGKYSIACLTLNGIHVLESASLYKECIYLWAGSLVNDLNLTEALKKYALIPDYKDVDEKIKLYNYQLAKNYYDEGNYDFAAVYYYNLGTYKDADKLFHYTLFILANQKTETDKRICFDCAIDFGEPVVTIELRDLRATLIKYDYPDDVIYDDIFWGSILWGTWSNTSGYNLIFTTKGDEDWMYYNFKYKTFDYWVIYDGSVWMKFDDGRDDERWLDITFTSSTTIEVFNHLNSVTYHLKKAE